MSAPALHLLAHDPRLEAKTLSTPVRFDPGTLPEWEKRRSGLLDVLRFWAGPRLRNREAPVHVLAEQHQAGFAIQNIAVETLPGFFVAGNLYIPDGGGPFPAVLHPHGHWPTGRFEDNSVVSVPARCINLALRGYVSLSFDMVGYGDTTQLGHRFGADDAEASAWGVSLFGLQVQNGLACLDYLVSRPDVDGARIAVTGASGGGSQTIALAAVDERIAVAVPVNMVSATCQGWCLCENPPGLRVETNNIELAALVAPRPMLLVSASGDWTSRTPEVEYPQLRRIYELYGVADHIANVHVDAPHNYNMESRQALYRWLDRWFMSVRHEEHYLEIPFPTPHRRTLEVDTNRLHRADDHRLQDALVDAARKEADEALRLPESELRARLGRLCGVAESEAPEELLTEAVEGAAFDARRIVLRRSNGELISCFQLAGGAEGRFALVLSDMSGHRALRSIGALLQRILDAGVCPLIVEPFLTDGWMGPGGRLGRTHSMPFFSTYNRTDAAEAVRDAATAIDYLSSKGRIELLVGPGPGALPLLIAAAIRPHESPIIIDASSLAVDPHDGFLVPGLRRLGGFRCAARLLASRRVVLVESKSETAASGEIRRDLEDDGASVLVGELADGVAAAADALPAPFGGRSHDAG